MLKFNVKISIIDVWRNAEGLVSHHQQKYCNLYSFQQLCVQNTQAVVLNLS